jgi:hypothetical protein
MTESTLPHYYEHEINDLITNLSNLKTPGLDHRVLNVYIKVVSEYFIPVYLKLFNVILENTYIPWPWTIHPPQTVVMAKHVPILRSKVL